MPLNDNQLEVIAQQRVNLNKVLEVNRKDRTERVIHSLSIGYDFLSSILTISLGLGAAIIPLLLLGENLDIRDKNYLAVSSFLLLTNAVYVSLVMKKNGEELSISANTEGLEERLLLLKLRNLLTKALLTKDEKFFVEYNTESRRVAKDSVEVMKNSRSLSLTYSTDICTSILVLAVVIAARPIVPLDNTLYFVSATVLISSMAWWFVRLNDKYMKLNERAKSANSKIISEEDNLNNFVQLLSEKKNKE